MCADSSTNTEKKSPLLTLQKNVRCQESGVTCHVSYITCHLSHVTCYMFLTPTATATDPFPANSPTLHSITVCKDPKINLFFLLLGYFGLFTSQKLQFLRQPVFCFIYVRNLFVINHLDLEPL